MNPNLWNPLQRWENTKTMISVLSSLIFTSVSVAAPRPTGALTPVTSTIIFDLVFLFRSNIIYMFYDLIQLWTI